MREAASLYPSIAVLLIMRQAIITEGAPRPVGPYSQAVICKGMVYCSGQIGLDPATGRLVEGGVEAQADRCLSNLEAVLAEAGSSLQKVVRCTVSLTDMSDFPKVNAIYARHFDSMAPSRTVVQVSGLPKGAAVEIDAIAEL